MAICNRERTISSSTDAAGDIPNYGRSFALGAESLLWGSDSESTRAQDNSLTLTPMAIVGDKRNCRFHVTYLWVPNKLYGGP